MTLDEMKKVLAAVGTTGICCRSCCYEAVKILRHFFPEFEITPLLDEDGWALTGKFTIEDEIYCADIFDVKYKDNLLPKLDTTPST